MGKYYFGSSYYPEWWSEEEWKQDFEKMADIGFNAVRMGEFAWSTYEPKDGEFDFSLMEKAVKLAGEYGISTILGTATAVCPPWLRKKHPAVKGGNQNGGYDFGGRKGNCLSDEVFIEHALRVTKEQAKAFAHNKNVVGWQLDNEPGFPFVCYDNNCEKKFRLWLKERYKTIDKLNEAWFSMMFSNVYNDFDEIELPVNVAEGGWNPGIRLDYRRFFSDNFNSLLGEEAKIIRSFNSNQFIYTNWPGANWSVSCEEAMSYLDYAAWDNYVPVPIGDDYYVQLRSSMEHDFCRRLSNGKNRFLVAEQCAAPHAEANPESVRAQTWLDISHGAFGNIFFEFRVPTGGVEQNYYSVLNQDRTFNRCENVIRTLSKNINNCYDLIDKAETHSPVAAVYSYQNSWSTLDWVVDGAYDEDFFEAYGGLKNAVKNNVDVIFPSDDLSKYKVIVAPNLMILSDKERKSFEAFVENGGVLIINPLADTKDSTNKIRQVRVPGLFNGNSGAHSIAVASSDMVLQQRGEPAKVLFKNGKSYTVQGTVHELVPDEGASVFAEYTVGRLKGKPAGTIKKIGEGYVVLYASEARDYCYYREIAETALALADVEPLLDVPDGVVISSRVKNGKTYLIAVNLKESPAQFTANKPLFDVINKRKITDEIHIDGLDVLFAEVI